MKVFRLLVHYFVGVTFVAITASILLALKLGFGQFIPFFHAHPLKLGRVGWEVFVNCHRQVSPKIFWGLGLSFGCATQEKSETCSKAGPMLSCLCVALEQLFFKDLSTRSCRWEALGFRTLYFVLTCSVNCGTLYAQVNYYKPCPMNAVYRSWTPIQF